MTLEELRAGLASHRSPLGLREASLAAGALGAALLARAAGAALAEAEPPGLAGFRQVVVDQSRAFREGLEGGELPDPARACRDLLGICERFLAMCSPDQRPELRAAAALLAAGVAAGRPDEGMESAAGELVARIMEATR